MIKLFTPRIKWERSAIVAMLGVLMCAGSVNAGTITNDTFWKDTSGNLLRSQGGGILKVGDIYYWYGINYGRSTTYAANPSALEPIPMRTPVPSPAPGATPGPSPSPRVFGGFNRSGFQSVTCYSSKDLVNWKFEGDALSRDQVGGGWFGRMGVVYSAKTKMYVMVAQGTSPQRAHGEYFATSPTPTGPFKFANEQSDLSFIDNNGTGDQTTFQDDDGKAYVICCSQKGRNHLYVFPLEDSDFLNMVPAPAIFTGKGREGNCMFKYKGRYYFCSSDLHGWNTSQTYVISAAHIQGPYGPESVMKNTELDFSHVTQSRFFVTVNGSKQTTVLYCGDRWSDFAGNGLGYNQWCPLSFKGTQPIFHSLSEWNLNAQTGEWSVGAKNNYVLNPSFEADRVKQTELAGWTATTNVQGGTPNGNIKNVAHTGNFCMQQKYSTDYNAGLSQQIDALPNGAYTLTAWVKSSGGQKSAAVAVRGAGSPEQSHSIATALDQWTQIQIPSIQVKNGKCEVAIESDAKANNWLQVDDLELVRN